MSSSAAPPAFLTSINKFLTIVNFSQVPQPTCFSSLCKLKDAASKKVDDLVADGGDDEQVAEDAKEGEAHLEQDARHNLDNCLVKNY